MYTLLTFATEIAHLNPGEELRQTKVAEQLVFWNMKIKVKFAWLYKNNILK